MACGGRRAWVWAVAVLAVAPGGGGAWSQTAGGPAGAMMGGVSEAERLRQAESRQAQIRAQTAAAADQLGAIIADYEINGLGDGEDVRLLRTLHGLLGALTADQMQQVIVLLQQARTPEGVAVEVAREAYERQQRIVTELRRVLAEYQRTSSAHALSARARALMERQQTAMRSAIDLAKALGDARGPSADDRTRASLAVQATEQLAIATELEELLTLVANSAATADRQQAERFRAGLALARDGGTLDQMRQAASNLQQNSLFRAATLQRNSRDGLRALWRQIGPQRDRAQQLSDAAMELQQHLELQTAVRQQTAAADRASAFAAAERRQGDLVDRADMTRRDLELLVPTASEAVREAIREMQRARQQLDRSEQAATQSQDAAFARLTSARDLVLAELERERDRVARAAVRGSERDRLERTREALEQVRDLRRQQDQQTRQPPPDAATARQQQQQLQDRAQELAARTAADNPAAAQELAEAARQMQQAQTQMSQSPEDPAAAQPSQARASQQLARAESRLAEQQARLEQAMTQLDRIAAAQQQLDEAIRQQAQASQSAADASAHGQGPEREAATAAARRQQAAALVTTETALPQVREASPEAAEALARAPQPMRDAERALSERSPAEARIEQGRSERALAEAQDRLSREADRIRLELDQPGDDPQQAAAAIAEIARQRDAAEQAQDALSRTHAEPSAGATTDAAAESMSAGSAALRQTEARDGHALPPSARQSVRSAADEMRQSASLARAGETARAAEAARRAQDLLAQALHIAEEARQMAAEQSGTPQNGLAQAPPPTGGEPGAATDPQQWDGRRDAPPGGTRSDGPGGSSAFLGLPPRERQTLQQSQADRYPQEYGAMVEQYLRNLSRQGSGGRGR